MCKFYFNIYIQEKGQNKEWEKMHLMQSTEVALEDGELFYAKKKDKSKKLAIS